MGCMPSQPGMHAASSSGFWSVSQTTWRGVLTERVPSRCIAVVMLARGARLRAMNNAELIVQMLEQAGVRWVFGVPSGPVLPLIEAIRPSPIQYLLTASETTAGYLAAMAGNLTGVP